MLPILETNYRRFFELSVDMLCIANVDGYFIEVNDVFSKVLGYSKSELLRQPILSFVHPKDINATQKELQKLGEGRVTLNFENRYRHLNGQYLTFSWSAQVDPESGHIYAVARDITSQRNQANKLAQIQKALLSETILAETDRKGVIQFVNDKFCAISGYSREELVGNTHKLINSGYHPREFFSAMWKTISTNQVWSGIIKNRKKNGDYYYVQTIITPIIDHEGCITNFLAIRQDITASVRQESDLAHTLKMLNETGSIAQVGGWELDIEIGELTWTDETFQILEVEKKSSRKPVLPEGLQLFVPEHQPIIENAVRRAIEHGEPYSLELKAQTAKGNVVWVYTNGKANYRDGKIVTLSGTIQNIDNRKKAEQKFNQERQKSIQSAKLASLGELAASMAHEINNPLGIIYGYTELMLESHATSPELAKKLAVVNKSCERISHIVKNLKKFSRTSESNDYVAESLSGIINEAISLAKPRIKRELVELKFSDQFAGSILCKAIEIEQVFLNLINNSIDAIKNTPNKWITISTNETDKAIECRVLDSGPGISEDIRAKIFSPFFTSKGVGEGTGLGLSIVNDLLKDHGASIHYDTDSPNTCFVILFNKMGEA